MNCGVECENKEWGCVSIPGPLLVGGGPHVEDVSCPPGVQESQAVVTLSRSRVINLEKPIDQAMDFLKMIPLCLCA